MTGPQNLTEWITLALAIWGAVLSTYLAIREVIKDRRRITVTCNPGILQLGPRREKIIKITAINTGHRPVQVDSAGFTLTNDNEMQSPMDVAGSIPLPKVIQDGETIGVTCYLDSLQKSIEEGRQKDPKLKIRNVFIRDAENNMYKGKVPKLLQDRKLATDWWQWFT